MYDKLIALGKVAQEYRFKKPFDAEAYEKAIEEIDKEAARIKAAHPDKFWTDDDPEYMQMSKQWDIERRKRDALLRASKP